MVGVRESAAVNAVDRRHQGCGRAHRDRQPARCSSIRELACRSFPRTPAASASTAGAASCGRRRHFLRLHRVRRRVDGGAGSAEPAARHADRHPRIAGGLHDPLRAGLGGHGRTGALPRDAQPAGAPRRRRRSRRRPCGRDGVAGTDGRRQSPRHGRRTGRPELGHGGDDAGAAAHLHGDVERRPATGVGRARPPSLSDTAHLHARDRRGRGDCRRAHANRDARQAA